MGGWAWVGLSLGRVVGGRDHATQVQLTIMSRKNRERKRGRGKGRNNNRGKETCKEDKEEWSQLITPYIYIYGMPSISETQVSAPY